MAVYMNVDTVWIRIAWLALLVLGAGVILYLIAWIAIPEADAGTTSAPRRRTGGDSGRFIIGSLLVLIGVSLLARQYVPWMQDLIMPAVLIGVGVGVVVYSLNK